MSQAANVEALSDSTLLLRSLTGNSRRPNLLLVCGEGTSDLVIRHLSVWCGHPVRCAAFPGVLTLPPDRTGTLLLHGVDKMTLAQQVALLDWLSAGGRDARGPQIVSMTPAPLEPLVMKGYFLEGLLRRLKVVQLDIA
jgi:hypothetical protein